MFEFIANNLATILVGAAVLAVLAAVAVSLVRGKRSGGSCSCGCGQCSGDALCHGCGQPPTDIKIKPANPAKKM